MPGTGTLTSVDTACAVTNNATTSVVVLDAYGSVANIATNAPGKGYQQSLKALSLAEGGEVLAPGATGTVTLDDTYTSNGQTKQSLLYQLLISDAASLFPVMNVGEAVDFDSMTYPPITVTEAAQANMKLMWTFVQSIRAYPSSNLATGFQTAMNQAQAQSSVTQMMQTIANWFNTTNTFKGLDLPSYLAVSSFIDSFAYVWGLGDDGVTPGRTYWLYAASDAGQQPTSGKSAPNQGSIVFTHNATTPADPTDRNSGYTITFTPSDGSAKTLTFSNGQFVDDPNSDLPAVCLQGSYALKSQYTQNTADNVLWPVLYGKLNGTQVIAVSQPPETWWQENISSKTFGDWCELGLKILGAAMALEWLCNKLFGKSEKLQNDRVNENNGADPDAQQQADADNAGDAVGQAQLQDVRQQAARMNNADNVPDDEQSLSDLIDSIKSDMVDVLNEVQGDLYDSMIDQYEAQLRELAEIQVNSDIEDAMSSLAEAKQNLADAVESGNFDAVKSSLADVKTSIGSAMENMDISQELRESLAESQQMIDEYQDTADEADDVKDDIENGDDPIEEIDAA